MPYINLTPPPLSDSAQETARKREAEELNPLLRKRRRREGEILSLYWFERRCFGERGGAIQMGEGNVRGCGGVCSYGQGKDV